MKKNKIYRRRCGAPPRVKITKEDLYNLYLNQKKSTLDIAKSLGINRATVLYHLKKFRIPLRKRIEAVSIGMHKKLTFHGRTSFSDDPIERQYILGISEDFSVSKDSTWLIKVALSTSHLAMINIFYEIFSKYGPIWTYPVKDKVGNYHWRVVTALDTTFDFILKSRRTHNIKTLSEEEFFSFISGLIDSEGSVVLSKSNKKYISRAIVIGSENEELLQKVYEKLKEFGFRPHLYKRKEKLEPSMIGNLKIKYNNAFWVLMITNKKDILRLSQKINLRHTEKINKLSLMIKTLSAKYWVKIKDKIENLRNKIQIETKQMKERARLAYHRAPKNLLFDQFRNNLHPKF